MPSNLTEAEIVLRALLANGPRCSREVLTEMAARGISAKQARTARERQRIVTSRSGSGKDMRTSWALLSDVAIHAQGNRRPMRVRAKELADSGTQQVPPDTARNPEGLESTQGEPSAGADALPAPGRELGQPVADRCGGIGDPEQERRAARVRAFIGRGLPPIEAERTADLLVHADRNNRHAYGSCAQCQAWTWKECNKARPPSELHVCWERRTLGP